MIASRHVASPLKRSASMRTPLEIIMLIALFVANSKHVDGAEDYIIKHVDDTEGYIIRQDSKWLKSVGITVKIHRLDGQRKFEVEFRPQGTDKSFSWTNDLVTWPNRKGGQIGIVSSNQLKTGDGTLFSFTIDNSRLKDRAFILQSYKDENPRHFYELNLKALMASTYVYPRKILQALSIDILGLKIGNTKLGKTLHPEDSAFKPPVWSRFTTSGGGYTLHFDKNQRLSSVMIILSTFKGSFTAGGKKINLAPDTSIEQLTKIFRKPDLVAPNSKTRDVAYYFLEGDTVEVVFVYENKRLVYVNIMDFEDLNIFELRKKEISEYTENRKLK